MIRRILLTLDGSANAEQAIPLAENQARTFNAELHLLRVVRPLAGSQQAGMASVSVMESVEKDLHNLAEDYLEGIARGLSSEGLEVQTAVRYGLPYNEIIQYAKSSRMDLIIMATRGESGVTRWLLGSVTGNVVRGSPVPVLVVPLRDSGK